MINAAKWIIAHRWAILPAMLETMIAIARRDISIEEAKEAIATKDGQPLEGTRRAEVRDGIAIIPVIGPIFPRANLFTAFSGGTSIQTLAKDFAVAMEDPSVKGIVLNVDSPGGEVTGVSEFAQMIYAARGVKPVDAYVMGVAASAGYWLASGARRIVMADTGEVGSIGVVSAWVDESKAEEKKGVQTIEIVSSVSPDKRLSPSTEAGRAKIQKTVDDLADVFVATVARNRGVDANSVISNYGQGWVKVGQDALDSGMVDSLGSLESVISEMSNENTNSFFNMFKGGSVMKPEDVKAKHPETYQAILAEGHAAGNTAGHAEGFDAGKTAGIEEGKKLGFEDGKAAGATAERERIQGIESIRLVGAEKVIADAKYNPEMTKEKVALLAIEAVSNTSAAAAKAHIADAQALGQQADSIGVGAPAAQGANDFEAAAKVAAERVNAKRKR